MAADIVDLLVPTAVDLGKEAPDMGLNPLLDTDDANRPGRGVHPDARENIGYKE
jgi:hypothetical protein